MKAQLREIEASLNHQMELAAVAARIEAFCQRVQQGLKQATFEQKRHLVELLIDRVVVTGEEVEIRYVIPTSPRGEASRFYQLRIPYCGKVSSDLRTGVFTDSSAKHIARSVRSDRGVSPALQRGASSSGQGLWQRAAPRGFSHSAHVARAPRTG